MGRRDDELNDAADDAEEQAFRVLLARYNEPRQLPPPPALAARVVAQVPTQRPVASTAAGRAFRKPGIAFAWSGLLLLALLALGTWGVFASSSGPAELLGNTTDGIGQLLLVLTLAAKPLVGLLTTAGVSTLSLAVITVAVLAYGWITLARRPTPALGEAAL